MIAFFLESFKMFYLIDSVMVALDGWICLALLLSRDRLLNIENMYSYKRIRNMYVPDAPNLSFAARKIIVEIIMSIGAFSTFTGFVGVGFFSPWARFPHDIGQVVKTAFCDNDACAICNQAFLSEEEKKKPFPMCRRELTLTRCGHVYHRACLESLGPLGTRR